MKILLKEYNAKKIKTFEDVIDLHQRFEVIHPFQDGNGRVGRLLMFKEYLANGFVPFIITDELKMFYCRGLQQWPQFKEYLLDTCLTAQDNYKAQLDYFKIKYKPKKFFDRTEERSSLREIHEMAKSNPQCAAVTISSMKFTKERLM